MPLSLADVLATEVVRAAAPEVLAGADLLDRPVRWVHTSEIYEIAPLLSGGELLLTSGLGLLGTSPGARRYYVRGLAERGVAGLALAVNRSFTEVPEEMVTEARRIGLPLVVLTEVVPFVRISEEINTALADDAGRRLRFAELLTSRLHRVLLAGGGVAGILAELGDVLGAPVVLTSSGGALLALHGAEEDATAWTVVGDPLDTVAVGDPEQWATLHVGRECALPPGERELALARAGELLMVAAEYSGRPATDRERQRAGLLAELADGAGYTDADVLGRAARTEFTPAPEAYWIAVAADASAATVAVLDHVGRTLRAPVLRASVRDAVLGFVAYRSAEADPARELGATVHRSVTELGAREVTVAIGHPVRPSGRRRRLAAALRETRDALRLAFAVPAADPGGRSTVVTARSLALELRLHRESTPEELAELVEQVLGGVLAWQRGHQVDLVRTIEVHLRHGGNATRTAGILHIGRQTLYQRLARIETLLGSPVTDPALHVPLLLACCAHRVLGEAAS